jgi:hypothetical protein
MHCANPPDVTQCCSIRNAKFAMKIYAGPKSTLCEEIFPFSGEFIFVSEKDVLCLLPLPFASPTVGDTTHLDRKLSPKNHMTLY